VTDTTPEAVCVVYAAKSTTDTNDSIGSQIDACRGYAGRLGWQVDEPPHSDENASAYHGSRGPGLVAAKARASELAAEGGDVRLLVYATDRLARGDGKQAAHLVEHVLDGMKNDYRVESVTEDLGGEMALVLASLYGQRNNADSRVKGAHTSRGIRTRVEQGHYHGGKTPYGYTIERDLNDKADPGRLVPVPAEAAVVQRIFGEYLGGAGQRTIALGLERDGIATPRGGRWDHSQVANMLRAQVYRGYLPQQTEGEYIKGRHEGLVDGVTWGRVQALRQARRASTRPGRPPVGAHLLVGGLLRCGVCGAAMRPRTRRRAGTEWYICRRREDSGQYHECTMPAVRRADVDTALLDHFDGLVFDLDATREQIRTAHDKRLAENRALRKGAEREKSVAIDARKRAKQAWKAKKLTADRYNELLDDCEEDLAGAEAKLAQLQARQREIEAEAGIVDVEGELLGRLATLRQVVAGTVQDAEGLAGLRAALATTFERIELVPGADGELGVLTEGEDRDFSLLCHVRLEGVAHEDALPVQGLIRGLPLPQTSGETAS
jgi:DNA invertase Pin-like site-specific DNA recombinase